jgi:hypothetical protein
LTLALPEAVSSESSDEEFFPGDLPELKQTCREVANAWRELSLKHIEAKEQEDALQEKQASMEKYITDIK